MVKVRSAEKDLFQYQEVMYFSLMKPHRNGL